MEVPLHLKKEILSAVDRFLQQTMNLEPTSILVNLQHDKLLVMLEGIAFPAEKACALNPMSQELLDRYHSRIFDASKKTLESEIRNALGRSVEHSAIRIEPVSGNGMIIFALGKTFP